ncbi:MAG: metallophosphoesterase, partial [Deltaproteobacteria bacterium]|nr:metallophosphoesterase [Deltaproteobacteria bacterium]
MTKSKFAHRAMTALSALALASCSSSQTTDDDTGFHGPDFIPGVSIVYTANIDGEIEPCGCRSNPTGGIDRRYNFLLEKVPGEKLSIDSGDLFYQSAPVPPFLEKQWNYQARVLLKATNALGVEAMTPGELDFANGLDAFQKLAAEARFKILSANLYRKDNGKRLLEPSVILVKGGKKVALFGLYDESLPLPPEVVAKDHLAEAKAIGSELRGKADLVFALTHEGLDKDLELAKAVGGIDAIFGAHTQSFLMRPEKAGDTLIFQPSFRGQHVGVYAGGVNKMFQI